MTTLFYYSDNYTATQKVDIEQYPQISSIIEDWRQKFHYKGIVSLRLFKLILPISVNNYITIIYPKGNFAKSLEESLQILSSYSVN